MNSFSSYDKMLDWILGFRDAALSEFSRAKRDALAQIKNSFECEETRKDGISAYIFYEKNNHNRSITAVQTGTSPVIMDFDGEHYTSDTLSGLRNAAEVLFQAFECTYKW